MTMLVANSDESSSVLSHSSIIPNSIETLNENEVSSSQTALIESRVNVQSLALSSPDRGGNDQDPVSILSPKSDGHAYSEETESELVPSSGNLDDGDFTDESEVMPESQIQIESPSRSLGGNDDVNSDAWLDETEEWHPNFPSTSNNYNTQKESHNSLFLGFPQEPMFIKEPVTGVGAGLWNLGNTCFLNSVLQCFTHTVPLLESLLLFKYQYPCNCGSEVFCVIRVLGAHIQAALMPGRFPMAPYFFVNNLSHFSPDFQRFQQEDAHEFLQAFLDKLERCCVDRLRSNQGYTSSQDDNIVEHVFGGRLVSVLRCCNCNSVSETFEKSVGLSLEIEDVDTLESALESFTRVEKLDEQMTCDNCNEKVSKEKQLWLDKLPLVATFHLKRFKNIGCFMHKIFKHVKIPLELELQPYMRNSQDNDVPTKYHLYASVEHLGSSLAYGHYISYVRSAPKIWHQFDDVEVTRVDEDSVLSQDSYILFYAREGTPWFSTAFEEIQPFLEARILNSSPKSVLDSSTNKECSSEISYENVDKSIKLYEPPGVSNQHVKREEEFGSLFDEPMEDVFLAAESTSGKHSPMTELLGRLEAGNSYNPWTEKPEDSCLARERDNKGDDFLPLLMDEDQDSSPKQQEGTFQMQLKQMEETTKNQEEPSNTVSMEEECVNGGELMKKHSPRAKELLDEAISESTCSPTKKLKMKVKNE